MDVLQKTSIKYVSTTFFYPPRGFVFVWKMHQAYGVTMDTVKKINLIRGGNRAQSCRKLVFFLEYFDAEYTDIHLYSYLC